jgi:hypothetical protein
MPGQSSGDVDDMTENEEPADLPVQDKQTSDTTNGDGGNNGAENNGAEQKSSGYSAVGALLVLLTPVGVIVSLFFSSRVAGGLLATGLALLLDQALSLDLRRNIAKIWFGAGTLVLVAATWLILFPPNPYLGPALVLGGALLCGMGLAFGEPAQRASVLATSLTLTGVYLLIVGVASRWFVHGNDAHTALAAGPVLITVAIGVETGKGRVWYRHLPFAAIPVFIELSVIAVLDDRTVVSGIYAGSVSVGLLLFLLLRQTYLRRPRRTRTVAIGLAVVAALAVPLGSLALIGLHIRTGAGYARAYGTLTTVYILDDCVYPQYPDHEGRVRCPAASWHDHREDDTLGSLLGTLPEIEGHSYGHADSVSAYVLGGRAFTPDVAGRPGRLAVVGRNVPLILIAALPAGLIAFFALELGRRVERKRVAVPAAATAVAPGTAPPTMIQPRTTQPSTTAPVWTPGGLALSETVLDAMRQAAGERRDGEPLTTGRILATLVRVDLSADWQRLWLQTGDPESVRLADAVDPTLNLPRSDWRGIPISTRAGQAFATLSQLSARYSSLYPANSGAMALALCADRYNGATDALLRRSGLSHARLLHLIESEIVRLNLIGLSTVVPAATAHR